VPSTGVFMLTTRMLTPRFAPRSPGLSADLLSSRLSAIGLALLLSLVILGLGALSVSKAQGSTGDGSALRQGLYILIFGFVLISAQPFRDPRLLAGPTLAIWMLLIWCLISLTWSDQGSIALRRLALTTIIIWTVFIAVQNAGFNRTVKAMQVTLVAILVVNYAMVIVSPQTAIHQVADFVDPGLIGDWKGALPQKNFAGAVCAMTVIILLFYGGWFQPLLRWAIILAAIYFLVRTGSKTSMGVLALSTLAGFAFEAYHPKFRALVIPCVVALFALVVLAGQFYWVDLVASFSHGNQLTGRALIWRVLGEYADDHWQLGAGFGSFWNVGPTSPVFTYTETWVNGLGNGHNGYLDLLVTIGAVGLLLAVIAFVLDPLWRLFANKTIDVRRRSLLIALLTFCAGHNFTETSLMDRDAIMQVAILITVALTVVATRMTKIDDVQNLGYWAWMPPRQKGPSPEVGGQERRITAQ